MAEANPALRPYNVGCASGGWMNEASRAPGKLLEPPLEHLPEKNTIFWHLSGGQLPEVMAAQRHPGGGQSKRSHSLPCFACGSVPDWPIIRSREDNNE